MLTVVLSGIAVPGLASPAEAAPVTCGQVLTESVSLSNDLTDCPGTMLVIGADDIVVDLNGHSLLAFTREIRTPIDFQGHDGVVLRNGYVGTIGSGLHIDGDFNVLRDLGLGAWFGGVVVSGDHNRITHSTIRSLRGDGVAISGGEGSVVDGVRAVANSTGISLADGSRNRVSNSYGDGVIGISVSGERSSTVTQSRALGGRVGVAVSAADGVVVSQTRAETTQRSPRPPIASFTVADSAGAGVTLIGNRTTIPPGHEGTLGFVIENNHGAGDRVLGNVAQNKIVGFAISNGHGTIIRNNVAGNRSGRSGHRRGWEGLGNLTGISVSAGSSNVVIADNRANYNQFDGISVEATNSLVRRNVANFNGGNGIASGGGGVTFTQNIAAYNGGTGLLAGPTDVDGGGNRAHHNLQDDCTSPPLTC